MTVHKNEIPEIEDDVAQAESMLETIRYEIDRIYASRKPIELETYGSLCNMVHRIGEQLALIGRKATDHNCRDAEPEPGPGAEVIDLAEVLSRGIKAQEFVRDSLDTGLPRITKTEERPGPAGGVP